MSTSPLRMYRHVLREVRKSSRPTSNTPNPLFATKFRSLFEKPKDESAQTQFLQDMENTLTFIRAQRIHKELLERYNPLFDLTAEERIEATARRVGLNMPKMAEQ